MDAPWVFGILLDSKRMRAKVRQKLADKSIETRNFLPLNLKPFMVQCNSGQIELHPNAEDLGLRGFYLPTFYNLQTKEIKHISQCIKDVLQG